MNDLAKRRERVALLIAAAGPRTRDEIGAVVGLHGLDHVLDWFWFVGGGNRFRADRGPRRTIALSAAGRKAVAELTLVSPRKRRPHAVP